MFTLEHLTKWKAKGKAYGVFNAIKVLCTTVEYPSDQVYWAILLNDYGVWN